MQPTQTTVRPAQPAAQPAPTDEQSLHELLEHQGIEQRVISKRATTDTLLPGPDGGVHVNQAGVGPDQLPEFLGGDIILYAGRRDFFSKAVRWVERTSREGPTYAVHSAQFLDGGRYLELDWVEKIRASQEIMKKRKLSGVWEPRGFEVWRCQWLTTEQREAVTQEALTYLGAKVGRAKFLTHMLDGLVNKVARREIFFFRRLNYNQRYPICSWATAFSYDRALNYQFGVPPDSADPDHISDWVHTHPDEWLCVFRLAHYS
jgi:hypothetical protein